MELKLESPITFLSHATSPELEPKKEAIRIALSHVEVDAGRVRFYLCASFLFPGEVADRYQHIEEAMVIVVHDIEQADGASMRAENTFAWHKPGARSGANQIAEPPLPMPGRGSLAASGWRGGWLNVVLSFSCPVAVPRYRPSVYVYLVFENYVSNVVAIDLVDKKAVEPGGA